MDNIYSAREVAAGEADRLYPLMQAASSGMTLERWRAFVVATTRRGNPQISKAPRGIMAIDCVRGYARALFTYSVEANLTCGRALQCDNLVVLNQFGIRTLMAAVVSGMHTLARRHDCQSIHVNLDDTPAELTSLLERNGFACEREVWCLQDINAN